MNNKHLNTILFILTFILCSTATIFAGMDVYYPEYAASECFDDFQWKCNPSQIMCTMIRLDADQQMTIKVAGDQHAAWCFKGDVRATNCEEIGVYLAAEPVIICSHLPTTQGHIRILCDGSCPAAYQLFIDCPLTSSPNTSQKTGQSCPHLNAALRR